MTIIARKMEIQVWCGSFKATKNKVLPSQTIARLTTVPLEPTAANLINRFFPARIFFSNNATLCLLFYVDDDPLAGRSIKMQRLKKKKRFFFSSEPPLRFSCCFHYPLQKITYRNPESLVHGTGRSKISIFILLLLIVLYPAFFVKEEFTQAAILNMKPQIHL